VLLSKWTDTSVIPVNFSTAIKPVIQSVLQLSGQEEYGLPGDPGGRHSLSTMDTFELSDRRRKVKICKRLASELIPMNSPWAAGLRTIQRTKQNCVDAPGFNLITFDGQLENIGHLCQASGLRLGTKFVDAIDVIAIAS
jgi:hypothetical protein